MKPIFQDYLMIFDKFPKGDHLTKTQRTARHQALLTFHHTTYTESITICELMTFIDKHRHDIIIDNPLFFKKITPILTHDINTGGTLALKFLTGTDFGYLFGLYEHCYHELYDKDITLYDLVEKLLIQEPDNLYAQEQKFDILCHHIYLSIHEVPWCVLFGSNSASIDDTYMLLKELDDFEQFSKKLQKPKPTIIYLARQYYLAWIDYLTYKSEPSFLAYLEHHYGYTLDE